MCDNILDWNIFLDILPEILPDRIEVAVLLKIRGFAEIRNKWRWEERDEYYASKFRIR